MADGTATATVPALAGLRGADAVDTGRDGITVVFVIPAGPDPAAGPAVGSWLHIGADGAVTAHAGKVEVGQGARTSLAQLVAEELRVPVDAVRLVLGDTGRTPYDIGTFSSLTTRTVGTQLRRVAAAARELVHDVAGAAQDPVARLAAAAAGRSVVATVTRTDAVTPPARWTVAGRDAPRAGAADLVTGAHRYACDLALPGMRYGRVLRPPRYGATLAGLRPDAAAAMPGVRVIRDGDLVGVTAPDSWTADRALAALDARWADPDDAWPAADALLRRLRDETPDPAGSVSDAAGSLDAGRRAARVQARRSYALHPVAHAPMEPRAAVARWTDGGDLTVWTGTQRPFAVRDELAAALGVPGGRVRVLVPDTGSAFGGKHTGDAAVEAARLARADGGPVKVVWTRAEEFTWAYFRPPAVVDVAAGATHDGALTVWEQHCRNAGAEGLRAPYRVANRHVTYRPSESPVRQGPYRALAATANHFARETLLDELAAALGLDPLALRRRNMDDPRLLAVLDAAASAFGWGPAAAGGRGHGLACGTEKGGYVATCAEVAVEDTGRVRVVRVTQAFECGAVVNPGHLRAQVEGAVIQGLGGALFERADLDRGRMRNPDLTRYRVPRFADVPRLDVVLLDRRDLPSAGAGECPIVCVAPAVGNALFAATGVRLRTLPLVPGRPTGEGSRLWA